MKIFSNKYRYLVAASLKSISPRKSSIPMISVSTLCSSPLEKNRFSISTAEIEDENTCVTDRDPNLVGLLNC